MVTKVRLERESLMAPLHIKYTKRAQGSTKDKEWKHESWQLGSLPMWSSAMSESWASRTHPFQWCSV